MDAFPFVSIHEKKILPCTLLTVPPFSIQRCPRPQHFLQLNRKKSLEVDGQAGVPKVAAGPDWKKWFECPDWWEYYQNAIVNEDKEFQSQVRRLKEIDEQLKKCTAGS